MRSALALAILLWSGAACACDCATSPLAQRARWSSEVFIAEVIEYKPLLSVELRVVESFKGAHRGKRTISIGPSDCDYFLPPLNPQPGDRFLVFMSKAAGKNTVSRCLGSRPAASADADLKVLRNRLNK
jgi:hypothetical protein